MTHFGTHPRFHQDKFWPRFMIIRLKRWPLEHTQGFSKIWSSNLVFDLKWPIKDLVWDFIKTNILTMVHDNQTKSVASRAYTSQKVDDTWRTQNYHNSSTLSTSCSGELKNTYHVLHVLNCLCDFANEISNDIIVPLTYQNDGVEAKQGNLASVIYRNVNNLLHCEHWQFIGRKTFFQQNPVKMNHSSV